MRQTGGMSDPTDSKNAPTGAISANVAASVEELRQAEKLSLRDLAERLDAIGWPMLPSTIHRIVQGKRRCGPDDIVALSIALGVNPSALLLPIHVSRDDIVELTPEVSQRANIVWAWADGQFPLPPDLLPAGTTAVTTPGNRGAIFAEYGRPDISSAPADPAIDELDELKRMIERVLAEPDGIKAWADWRDVILRRVRLVAIQLEEMFARLDRDARDVMDTGHDTAAAIGLLQEGFGRIREPLSQYIPGTMERYTANARAEREKAPGLRRDPNEARGAANTMPPVGPNRDTRDPDEARGAANTLRDPFGERDR